MVKRFIATFFSIQSAKRFGFFFLLFNIIFLPSCQTQYKHAPEIDFANVCKKENDGKLVAVEGYITFPKSVVCKSGNCDLELRKDQTSEGKSLDINVALGKEPGQMDYLSQSYTKSEFKFHTAQGDSQGPIKVIGKVSLSTYLGLDVCRLDVKYAEKSNVTPSPSPSSTPISSPVPKMKK